MKFRHPHKAISALLCVMTAPLAQAEDVNVAVAANFTAAMKEIAAEFEKSTGHHAIASFGSTGKLYTQIINGAPFQVFLAADQKRPKMLEKQNLASREFTYAIGRLVLWSSDADRQVDQAALEKGDFRKLAIANPKTAPYGAAAVEVLKNLGTYSALSPKLITGDSIAQTHQFVATGNAELGFVALAQIALDDSGNRWEIPQSLYSPIRQDAVLLSNGQGNPAAQALLDYLHSDAAEEVIHRYGYSAE